jgi:hypothetical protein
MSDREIIIQLLRTVEWRVRANRLLHELALALSAAMAILIVFKVWDLFSPFEALAIEALVGISAALLIAFAVWRGRQRGTLDQAAAMIDHKAGLGDEIKTAFWFINNPRSSEWIDRQIQRAAKTARNINVNRAYPNMIPRASYMFAAAVLLFAGLNFIPLRFNNNWLMLQAAAPDRGLDKSATGETILDREEIMESLKEIAALLRESELLEETADDLARGDIEGAADDLEDLANQIGNATAEQKEELRQAMKAAAASNKKAELEEALQEMGDTSETAEDTGIYEELMETAESLNQLAQQLKTPVPEGTSYQTGKTTDDSESPESVQVSDVPPGELKQSNTGGPGGSTSAPGGLAQLPKSLEAQLEFDVKLQAEALSAIDVETKEKAAEKDEEEVSQASKQERSKVDYRNVESQLTPAQKDLLNQDHVPWEYRALIKSYFQSIRPPEKK